MRSKPLFALGMLLLLLAAGVMSVSGQGDGEGGDLPETPLITTATNTVGLGTLVAAEAYAVPAGEDPATEPVQAFILPYAIHPNLQGVPFEEFEQPDPAVEGFTFEWSLEAPEGSQAELSSGTVASFVTDVEGQYVLSLTATDEAGNSGTNTWTVNATTYVGDGITVPVESESLQ